MSNPHRIEQVESRSKFCEILDTGYIYYSATSSATVLSTNRASACSSAMFRVSGFAIDECPSESTSLKKVRTAIVKGCKPRSCCHTNAVRVRGQVKDPQTLSTKSGGSKILQKGFQNFTPHKVRLKDNVTKNFWVSEPPT